MLKKDFNDSVRNLYNINPDNLEDEYINVVKAFYLYSRLTTEAYSDQLIAKDKVKKVSAKIFLKSKMCGDTDKKAENVVSADEGVVQEAKKDYFEKVRIWEGYKNNKESAVMKHDVLKSIGFNRKTDSNIDKD
jgi:hypothetical protein